VRYVEEYRYDPDVEELRVVLASLYELADKQVHVRQLCHHPAAGY